MARGRHPTLIKNKLAITVYNDYEHIVGKSCEAWNFFADNKAAYHTVYLYDIESGKSKAVTDGLSDAIDPVFDAWRTRFSSFLEFPFFRSRFCNSRPGIFSLRWN